MSSSFFLLLFLFSSYAQFHAANSDLGEDAPSLEPPEATTAPSSESALITRIRQMQENGPPPKEVEIALTLKRSIEPQQHGLVPDPNRVADPSLLPVHLQKPDYRPLSGSGGGGPKPKQEESGAGEDTSATVAGMGGGEEAEGEEEEKQKDVEGEEETTSTTTEVPTTTTTTTEEPEAETEVPEMDEEAKAAQKEAEAKAEEAAAAAAASEAAAAEAEAKRQEAEAAKEAAEALREKAASTEQTAAESSAAGEKVAAAMEEIKAAPPASAMSDSAVAALADAIRGAKLLVQNITLVLPGAGAPGVQALLNALLGNAAREPPEAMAAPLIRRMLGSNRKGTAQPQTMMPPPYVPPAFDPFMHQSQSQFAATCRPSTSFAPQHQQPPPPSSPFPARPTGPFQSPLVDVEQLHSWVKSGRSNLKVLDASYEPDPGTLDHVQFYADYYAKWDKLMREKKSRQYARSHIPGAVPFNLNIATYPSWNERQALYPADKFEQYVRRLGIDRGDQLVLYARGPLGGMLHAARAWHLFRIYGHDNVTVLDGGMDAWRQADLPATDADVHTSLGNWRARFRPELVVTFEELTTAEADGYCILNKLNLYNFLDARPRNEFFGLAGGQMMGAQRSRLPCTKSFPADELIQDGMMMPAGEIIRRLHQSGYSRNYPTIVMGNIADEASLALLALAQVQDTRARLYNGGMEEIRRRAPQMLVSNR